MKSIFDSSTLYDIYTVKLQTRGRLCGGTPRNKELIRSWVEASTGHKDEQTEKLIQEDADLMVNEVAEKSWIGFMSDERGLLIQARNVKACLKQSASLLGITKKKRGSKQILRPDERGRARRGGGQGEGAGFEPLTYCASARINSTSSGVATGNTTTSTRAQPGIPPQRSPIC